jgi:hypothetical protein
MPSGRDDAARDALPRDGIPRGIEVLVKKAAIDAEFKVLLLNKRARAARAIALELDASEAAMLDAIPVEQLEAIIAATKVDEKTRPAFLGRAAAIMIVALGVGEISGCNMRYQSKGVRPDRPAKTSPAKIEKNRTEADDGGK